MKEESTIRFFTRAKSLFFWLFVPLVVSFLYLILFRLEKELHLFKKTMRTYRRALAEVTNGVGLQMPLLGGVPVPRELQNIPLAEKMGIVLGTKKVSIRDILAPYNASIIENGSGYLLFFRYDVIKQNLPHPFFSHIGMVELDAHFEQTEKAFRKIETHSNFSEDPRILKAGNAFYLIYNDLVPYEQYSRTMRIANIDLKNCALHFSSELNLNLQPVEKNWVPFEFIGENSQPIVYFEYQLNPHKILALLNPQSGTFDHLTIPTESSLQNLFWSDIWGKPRGGTTARRIGDQYLAFFHSSFHDRDGIVWYLMGAYTFEAKPPFRVTAISNFPILFEGIYDSPPLNTANPLLRAIYPCSFVFEQQNGKHLIHVACGENDSCVKIVTMDEEALLKSLKKL